MFVVCFSYLHLLLRAIDVDGILSGTSETASPVVTMDEKKAVLPDLVEITLASKKAETTNAASQKLQEKISTMLKDLETTVGVHVETDLSAELTNSSVAASGTLTPAALICANTVFQSFDTNGDRILTVFHERRKLATRF